MNTTTPSRVVVVGGGAGGLVLATRLRRKHPELNITLVDSSSTHIWKPLLHEIASGAINADVDSLSYIAHASNCGFEFQLGELQGLDRKKKEVILAPIVDDAGHEAVPERRIGYDVLVIAIGSVCNDFGTPGADRFCLFLDTPEQAKRIHRKFLDIYLAAHAGGLAGLKPARVDLVIVGGGATGIELAAELHGSVRKLIGYGLDEIPSHDVSISIIEAGSQLLPALSSKLAASVEKHLRRIGVQLYLNERVTSVSEAGVSTQSGKFIPGTLIVWAAGVKAPTVTTKLDGLAVNRINQLEIRPTLQTTEDDSVFAIGDCSALAGTSRRIPPTAQVANQEAMHLARNLGRFLEGNPMHPFLFSDKGTLVSLGETNTFGQLMGNLLGTRTIRGLLARLAYLWLYRRHQYGLFGAVRTIIITLGDNLRRTVGPKLKLH